MVGSLRRCEQLAADLLAEQSRLTGHALAAERTIGLSAVSTQSILAELIEATTATAGTRARLVAGHRRLERLGHLLNIDMSLYGDAGKTPGGPGFTEAADTVRIDG